MTQNAGGYGPTQPAHLAADHAARASYGRLLAMLAVATRDIAAAEDALAGAFARALEHWPQRGVPENPDAWLLTTARRLHTDALRHAQVEREHRHTLASARPLRAAEAAMLDADAAHIPDERLKMLYLCAHPAIDPAVRTPLMLQTVLGLDARRIASAFIVSPAALAQRLVRAKAKIRDAAISFDLPGQAAIFERLGSVLESVYAAFNAGWELTDGPEHVGTLAESALWLGQELVNLTDSDPEASGLLALMLLSASRRAARRTDDGQYVPLSLQDTAKWDPAMIARAEALLARAAAAQTPGRFQLEAAIQSAHAARAITGATDWPAILTLYDALLAIAHSIGATVARAAAITEAIGPAAGEQALAMIDPRDVPAYQPYWATLARIQSGLGNTAAAAKSSLRAAGLSDDPAVRAFLLRSAARGESV